MRPLQRARGFSLLEVLVAFAIAAVSLGMIYQVMGNNARHAGGLTQHERAMLFAESVLAANETVPPDGLNVRAETTGLTWTLRSRPFPTPANSNPQAIRLHELLVHVAWLDGTSERSYELTSLRPERQQPPGTVR